MTEVEAAGIEFLKSGDSRPDVSPHSAAADAIGLGLLGMGVVGAAVARTLSEKNEELQATVGRAISLNGVLVRDPARPRAFEVASGLLTTDAESIINSPGTDIVVEVMGGEHPALEYIIKSISLGKHVVTANKEVMALHGPEILALAAKHGVRVLFEASVAAGTPVIAPLTRDLVANEVVSVRGIVNGTTNYILTKMAKEGMDFDDALREAQDLGYAEADPTSDVDGIDAAWKLAILSSLAFGVNVKDTDVYREGIRRLVARDFVYAADLGYAIKLMAIATRGDIGLQVRVHPALVSFDAPIARVDGVMNAVEIDTDLSGPVLFHGRGAGPSSTASALLANVVDIAEDIAAGVSRPALPAPRSDLAVEPMALLESKYYLRLQIADRPGVLAQIAKVLGDLSVSIDSVLQKQASEEGGGLAELVITTHRAGEAAVQQALREIAGLGVVRDVGNMVRIDG